MKDWRSVAFLCILFLAVRPVSAQVEKKEKFTPAIEDNSFLIEEAYNQEFRVVQHISTLMYVHKEPSSYFYTFTQEWPAGSQLHQLSYTIPLTYISRGSASGIGDIMINYRYQLFGHDDFLAAAPRLSLILPTGSSEKGLGSGHYGMQVNLPLSKRLTEKFVVHLNAGATALFSKYQNKAGGQSDKVLPSYFWGGSLIWLAAANFNFLLEYLNTISGEFAGNGDVNFSGVHVLNPGFRAAVNINSLQIVPGFSVPVSIGEDRTYADVFFYLSFEHPF